MGFQFLTSYLMTSQYSDGWIVPSDEPTLSAQRNTSLNETAFNEFDTAYTADSLTVTIAPGEGHW